VPPVIVHGDRREAVGGALARERRNFEAAMDGVSVVAVLDCLDDHAITTWVDGGWGIDALVGRQTREHEDLDLVVAQDALAAAQAALHALRYRHDRTVNPGLPARLVLRDSHHRQVDLHPVVVDAQGSGWQPLGGGAWGGYPAEGLTATGVIGGRLVRCLTPELQLLGYAPDAHDRHDLRLLRALRRGLAARLLRNRISARSARGANALAYSRTASYTPADHCNPLPGGGQRWWRPDALSHYRFRPGSGNRPSEGDCCVSCKR
jgi:lincosamide nucleotidyltransferase A/C/D/E